MAKRQMVFGVICFLAGVLVGIEIAGVLCNVCHKGGRRGGHKERNL
jgi:hypothetical protein